MRIKQGDVYDVTWTVNMDVTGATARVIASRAGTEPVILAVTPGPDGVLTHTLTGTLPAGTYRVEAEVTIGDEVITFPTPQDRTPAYDTLEVLPDLD